MYVLSLCVGNCVLMSGELQTTLNLLRDHGAIVVLDTFGKNRISYSERCGHFRRHGRVMETVNDYTSCGESHVVDAIEKYGVLKVVTV